MLITDIINAELRIRIIGAIVRAFIGIFIIRILNSILSDDFTYYEMALSLAVKLTMIFDFQANTFVFNEIAKRGRVTKQLLHVQLFALFAVIIFSSLFTYMVDIPLSKPLIALLFTAVYTNVILHKYMAALKISKISEFLKTGERVFFIISLSIFSA